MYRLSSFILVMVLFGQYGCAQMDSMRLLQDRPENLEPLVQQHEYARARQLTGKYPSLDTLEIQAWITTEESAYEASVFAEARTLETGNDLLGAVNLLSDALQKIPHSTLLRELRTAIEQERHNRLSANEREQLLSSGNFMLEQQKLYSSKINLESPSMTQRWENKRNKREAAELAGKLLQHGIAAMENDHLEIAEQCLRLSNDLNPAAQTAILLDEINSIHASREHVEQKQASIKKAKIRKKVRQRQTSKTSLLVKQARQALADDELQEARTAIAQIPASSREREDVVAIQGDLNVAIGLRVDELLVSGDSQYRADDVLGALRSWTAGLLLDPENPELRERVERANRVLAKLEELKGQQPR